MPMLKGNCSKKERSLIGPNLFKGKPCAQASIWRCIQGHGVTAMTTPAECARSASRDRIAKAPVAAKLVWAASEVATSAPDDSPNPVEPVVGTASLESILRTEELHRRPWRAPNYET